LPSEEDEVSRRVDIVCEGCRVEEGKHVLVRVLDLGLVGLGLVAKAVGRRAKTTPDGPREAR